jgi:hypothetical protein
MLCQHVHELSSDYVAGQLDRALIATVDIHLAGCAECRDEVAGLRRVWSGLDTLPSVELPEYFHENLMHRLNAELDAREEHRTQRSLLGIWRGLFQPRALAAVAVLIVVLTGAGYVKTQQAGINPLSWVGSLLHPHPTPISLPALQKPVATWLPGDNGTGTLEVQLQLTSPTADGADLRYTVALKTRGLETHDPALAHPVSGVLSREGKTIVRLALSHQPDAATDTLLVTIHNADREGKSVEWSGPLSSE